MLHAKNYLFCAVVCGIQMAARNDWGVKRKVVKAGEFFYHFYLCCSQNNSTLTIPFVFAGFTFPLAPFLRKTLLWLFRIKIFLLLRAEKEAKMTQKILWSGNVLLRILFPRKSFYLNNIFGYFSSLDINDIRESQRLTAIWRVKWCDLIEADDEGRKNYSKYGKGCQNFINFD